MAHTSNMEPTVTVPAILLRGVPVTDVDQLVQALYGRPDEFNYLFTLGHKRAADPELGVFLNPDSFDRHVDDKYGRRYQLNQRAELFGVDRSTLYRYRNGVRVTDVNFIARVLHALPGATFADLFTVETEAPSSQQAVAA